MFSTAEEKVIKAMGRRKVTIAEITKKVYPKRVGGNNVVANIVRRITVKCKVNRLPWTIEGEGQGRAGRTVWKTKTSRLRT